MPIKAVLVNDTTVEMHAGCISVISNISNFLNSYGIEIIYYHPVTKKWSDSTFFLDAFEKADLIILNAEGSIHHSNGRAKALSGLGVFCQNHGKRSVVLNGTYYENNDEIYKNLACFDMVCARDYYSLERLEEKGINAFFAPDMTFYTNVGGRKLKGDHDEIAVTDSVFPEHSSFLKELCCKVEGKWLPIISSEINLERYISDIAKSKLIITGRFHVVCFCLNTNTPFVALESNTPKISFLLKDVFGERCSHERHERVVNKEQLQKLGVKDFSVFSTYESEKIISYKKRAFFSFKEMGENIQAIAIGA